MYKHTHTHIRRRTNKDDATTTTTMKTEEKFVKYNF